MRLRLTLLALLLAIPAANAGVSKADLNAVSADPKPNAALPLDTQLIGEDGKALTLGDALDGMPAVLVFADYTCTNLCGPILAFAAGGLEKTKLTPGRDYRLIAIGIDPKDSLADAEAMKASRIGTDTPLAKATLMLRAKQPAVDALTAAAGYHYTYDAANDQFAHPAAAYVVTANGHIAHVLSGLGLDAADLRLALVDAGKGKIGTFADQVRLLCYGFDPSLGVYTENITKLLAAGGVLTVLILGGGIAVMTFKTRGRETT